MNPAVRVSRWQRPAVVYSRWFLALWGLSAAGSAVAWFLVPFWWFAVVAGGTFGPLEAIGMHAHNDAYPPLTLAIRRYLPGWATFALLFFLVGCVLGRAMGAHKPLYVGILFGFLGWLTEHFVSTYSRPGE
jgi:hypothetical protein